MNKQRVREIVRKELKKTATMATVVKINLPDSNLGFQTEAIREEIQKSLLRFDQ